MTNKVKTNKMKLEVEKEIVSYQIVQFSSRFNKEQVDDWIEHRTVDDFWLSECDGYWSDGDPLVSVGSPQVEDGQGDDHCPYDDEIQEWINENK